MASSSSPSPSFTAEPAEYDVFLSFRGEDTRDKFTSHLYDALCKKQIRPFIDPQVVDSRDEMAPSLLKTIEGSKISVVIFSEGYASSTWCLDELVKILECRKLNGQIVLPVFYHVSPNDVRRQRGNFGNRFLELEKRFKDMPEKVQLWRAALTDAGNLPGWDSALIRPVSMLVEEIVKYVLKKLEDISFSSDFEGLIGIESRLEKVLSLMCLESQDVRIVGIWGMTGLGKTTIAEAVFNVIQKDFEGKCFMSDVGEESEKGGLLRVRDRVVAQLLEENYEVGRAVLTQLTKNRLRRKRVLIVLDDVNKFTQLYSLIGGLGQFGLGSRIIVTTRDKMVLLNYGVDYIYEVERLNYQESLVLFCNYAFRQNQCPQEFVKLSKKEVDFANGSPLALKVLGSFFFGKIKQEWKYVGQEQMHDLLGETGLDIALRESGIEPGNRSELLFHEDVYKVKENYQVKKKNKKLELVPFSKGDKMVSLFKLECDRLDSHAIALKSKTDLKQLRLKLAEVHYLLQDTECMDLRGIIYDIDQLIDDWEQSEMSKSKFEQEVRRIHGQLLQILNSFHKLDAGHDAVNSAISHGSSITYDEYPLSETDIDRFINQVIYEFLRDVNVVRIVPLVGTRGIGKTLLAQRIYTDEKMKSHFPFRCWFSVGKNLDLSTIVKAIALQYREMVDCRDILCKRLLIVLDDVCEIDDEKLESFRLLISNMRASGSCVLLSSHSLHLATRMSSVPAGHLTWWPEFHSQAPFKSEFVPSLGAADSPVIQHELMAPESVVMTEPHRHSISRHKDEMTSNLPGHFGVVSEIVPASDTEPMSDMDEDPVSGPKNLTEDDMTLPPQTEELATHVPGNTTTISDGKGRMQPIDVKIESGLFQNKGDKANPMLNVCVNQSVEASVPKEAIGLSPINLTAVKSMNRNVQKIVRYVNDVTVSTVGVHGIGGIGKTTVLKALINHSEIKHMFQVIVFVTVSRYGNIRKIQNEVLRQLSLSRKDCENDSEVAKRLWNILNIKKFLLLLDDVWGQIDLKAVGIPIPSSENGCKLIMASRKIDLFHNMNVSKVIEIKTLPRKEGWKLFSEQVGGIIQLPAIKPYARAIVKGCHGLPLLIIVTGKALMEENDVIMWRHAFRKFSLPNTDGVCHTKDVIQRLKFSFDRLKDPEIKSCFIQCGLFPEDREVTVVELIESCIQEGIITGTEAEAYKRGCDIVDVLAKASLVQVTEDGNTITMHDLIRDLALGILSSAAADDDQSLLRAQGSQLLLRAYSRLTESVNIRINSASSLLKSPETDQFFLGAGAGLREPPLEVWEQAKMVFLMDNELCTLPETLSCSNLLILSLQRNFQLRDIPPSFFKSMTSLKFLNLSNTRIKSLPNTISELRKLQILILRDCERLTMLPSEVGFLVSLEVLDLRGTEIYKLPDEIVSLVSLRYLEVFFYGSIDEAEYASLPCNLISRDTISRLQALEALSIVVFPGDERWYQDMKYVISEVSSLMKLSSLRFHFPQTQHVKEFLEKSMAWRDQQLTKFNFVVGYDVKSITSRVPDSVEFDYNQQDKCLRNVNGECLRNVSGEICPTVIQILARCDAFYLDHHLDIESLSDFGLSNINGLKFCIISECPRIKTVVNSKEHTAAVFPSLKNLNINLLWNLTCIWEGTVPRGSLAELRILSVRTCPKLEFILTRSMSQFLTKLEELTVEDCGAIGSILLEDEIIGSSSVMLPSLKRLRLHDLPELVNIWKNVGSSVEHISIYNCPKLKKMGMESSKLKDTLIEIKAEKKWWAELQWDDIDMPSNLEDRFTIIS